STCTSIANGAGHPGNFVALLGSAANDIPPQLGTATGWVRADGHPVIATPGDISDPKGTLYYQVRLTESNIDLISLPPFLVWTGTNQSGLSAGSPNCTNWTSVSNTVFGAAGDGTSGSFSWLSAATVPCNSPAHLYCFQVDYKVNLTFPRAPGRTAFLGR